MIVRFRGKLDHHVSAGRKRDGNKQLPVSLEFKKYGNTSFRRRFPSWLVGPLLVAASSFGFLLGIAAVPSSRLSPRLFRDRVPFTYPPDFDVRCL